MGALAEGVIRSAERQLGECSPPAAPDSKVQEGVNKLVELFSKLNPSAKEFVPSCYLPVGPGNGLGALNGVLSAHARAFVAASDYIYGQKDSSSDGFTNSFRRRKNNHNQGSRSNARVSRGQREESIRRTVYVSGIDQHVTEEQLAALFANCGQVVDCRVCGDPHSVLRFAFVEFSDERSAKAALNLSGTMLGYYPVKVLPSKTAILPVNPTFLPRSEDEREICTRTIYCTNIDMKVSQEDVRLFFESLCGEVSHLRLLGDRTHSTRIAFVEFVMAHSAIFALNCSGMILGTLPIRVSPSKTPVRPHFPRSVMH